jgi:small nuclear ribonucleoprotein (snRNP)-like protein
MKDFKRLFSGLLLLTSLAGFAGEGDRGGNGGDGIYIDDKLYLLDFVEAGIEESPLIIDVAPTLHTKMRVDMLFPQIGMPRDLIARKITELRNGTFPFFGALLLDVMELYQWRLVNSKLIDIKDENTVLQYENLEQLAVRKNSSIMIDRSLWEKLDDANKVGLIFHEAIYALIKPRMVGGILQQLSDRARELNGKIFGVDSWMNLGTILNEDFDEDMNLVLGDNEIYISTIGGVMYSPLLTFRLESRNDDEDYSTLSFGHSDPAYRIIDQAKYLCRSVKGMEKVIIRDEAKLKAVKLSEFESDGVLRKYARMTDGQVGAKYSTGYREVIQVVAGADCFTETASAIKKILDIVKNRYITYEEVINDEEPN